MKKLAIVFLASFLTACSTTQAVNLTIDNKGQGTVSVWVDRPPHDMVDMGTVAPGEPGRRQFEVETGSTFTVYVDNFKYFQRKVTMQDPDPLVLKVAVKKD